jgi:hypothetical protein
MHTFALGLFTGIEALVRAHGEKTPRINGDVTVALTGVSAVGRVGGLTPVVEQGTVQLSGQGQIHIHVSDPVEASIHEAVGSSAGHSTVHGVGASIHEAVGNGAATQRSTE